jgi:hypothetical protein
MVIAADAAVLNVCGEVEAKHEGASSRRNSFGWIREISQSENG